MAGRRSLLGRTPRASAFGPPSWASVVAGLAEGLLLLEPGGQIVDANPAAESLIGRPVSQLAGRRLAELGPAAEHAWLDELVATTVREGLARRRAEGDLRRRGSTIPVSATCAPTYDDSGHLAGAVLMLHDLSFERALQESIRHADRLATLGVLAQGLAHEIRNPLGGIQGAAQLLRASVSDPEHLAALDLIVCEVRRLDGLLEQLRTLGTPSQLRLEPVNIHRVLRDVLALQQHDPGWGEIVLTTEFDPSLPPVRGDAAQLTQVFLNLVKNATESLQGRGRLVVATRLETAFHVRGLAGRRHYLSVTIADDGPGVAADDRDRLFSPFFTTKPRGSGLGLATCHRIVSEHGGTIVYEPRPGGGATFRVRLPITNRHEPARS